MNYFSQLGVFSVIAVILAIAATVLAFIFIVPEKKYGKLNKFGQFLHKTLNFKYLIIEKILQALYIYSTALIILLGFFMLFIYIPGGYYSRGQWLGGYGLLTMILGPVFIRIIYEFIMMAILLIKNVISINNKLKNQNPNTNNDDLFATPDINEIKSVFTPSEPAAVVAPVTPEAPAENQAHFCTKCGAPLDQNGKCPNCDIVE